MDPKKFGPTVACYDGSEAYCQLPISKAYVVVSHEIPHATGVINHWHIFFNLEGRENECIYFDLLKKDAQGNLAPQQNAVLCIMHRTYDLTNARHYTFPLVFADGTTIEDALIALHDKGALRYRYHNSGVGYHYWIQRVVGMWQDGELLGSDRTAILELRDILHYVYQRVGNQVVRTPSIPVQGTFY
ncbi:unnamed protein product [Somion occarium]|uniref:DUF7770 domain-containing protein n=1 Tax=Somion occarium TaxID=3059160 RepID=A0ABP1CLT4_9APHY